MLYWNNWERKKYYQKTAEPIKLYEIPGFNDKLSVSNSASKLFELINGLNSIKDEIHIILFFLNQMKQIIFKKTSLKF